MRIQCPACSTVYELSAEALGENGRMVRCAKCRHNWHATPMQEPLTKPNRTQKRSTSAAKTRERGEVNERNAAKSASPAALSSDFDVPVDVGQNDLFAVDAPIADPEDEGKWDVTGDDLDEAVAAVEETAARTQADDTALETDATDSAAEAEDVNAEVDIDPETEEEEQLSPELISEDSRAKVEAIREAQMAAGINSGKLGAPVGVKQGKAVQEKTGLVRQYGPMAAAAVVALSLIIGPVLFREPLVRSVPDLASLYSTIGLDVNLRGLTFEDINTFREIEDGSEVLVVEGLLRNVDKKTRVVPAVRLALRDEDATELYAWAVEPRTLNLEPGESTRFRARLAAPPQGASDVVLRFVDRTTRRATL